MLFTREEKKKKILGGDAEIWELRGLNRLANINKTTEMPGMML